MSIAAHRGDVASSRAPRGATLLLALMILGSLTAASLTVGTIVTRALRSARAIDEAVIAATAVDSVIEDILYRIRKEGTIPSSTSGRLANGATWTRTVRATTPELRVVLARDRTEQLDLFDPSGVLRETNIRALRITRLPVDGLDTAAWLEVTWVPWVTPQQSWAPGVARRLFSPSDLGSGQVVTVDLAAPQPELSLHGGTPAAYRVRLRAISGDVGPVAIVGLGAGGTAVAELPARVTAEIRASYGIARSAATVTLPARSPLAPVFDHVLFSECDIVKGDTVQCP